MTDLPLIRRAIPSDLEGLVPLFDGYRVFYGQSSDPALAEAFLSERLDRADTVILVAENEDRSLTGFVQLFPSFSSVAATRILILNDLFVDPASRRHHVGDALLEAAIAHGRKAGVARLTLRTQITNTAAQAAYEKGGWVRDTAFYTYDYGLSG